MSRLLYVFTALLLVSKSALSAAPPCVTVVASLAPCLDYLKGKAPTANCCAGVKNLKVVAKTKADKVAVCNCTKDVLRPFKYDPKIIPALPKKCGVNLELPPVDQKYDCSKVKLDGSTFRVLLEGKGMSDI